MEEAVPLRSYKPSWVVRMREKIEQSQAILTTTQSQINVLKANTAALSGQIDEAQKQSTQQKGKEAGETNVSVVATRKCYLLALPSDCLFEIFSFLPLESVINFDNCSKESRKSTLSTHFWHAEYAKLKHLHAAAPRCIQDATSARDKCWRHLLDCSVANKFLREMKKQRCVPKHNVVGPRLLGPSGSGISHPLPVFDSSSTENGKIMSRSETLDRDFRSVALAAMQTIVRISSFPCSEALLALVRESAGTVFVSLLSNEAQQLKHLACSCLANLLYWDDTNLGSGGGGGLARSASESITRQLELCEASKVLYSLLSSPSATINLAGTLLSGGPSTSPVQGMCNREGSRALVNLFCPSLRVPPPIETIIPHDAAESASSSDILKKTERSLASASMSEMILSEFPVLRAWRFYYYTRSGALKDEFTTYLTFSVDGHCRGRGCDSIGFFVLDGQREVDIQGPCWKLCKQYLSQSALEELSAQVGFDEAPASLSVSRAHVVHTAYFTPGLLREHGVDQVSIEWAAQTMGLYGIWENATTGSHYLLEKGGVFRGVAIF